MSAFTEPLPVDQFLQAYYGRKVFFEPLWGNHGDRLIRMGSREAIHKAGLTLVSKPDRASLILINGGASMTHFRQGIGVLVNYLQGFPHTTLAVLPTSWDVQNADLAPALASRTAPAYLYARERYSLAVLERAALGSHAILNLDHDMAFHLEGSKYLGRLRQRASQRHILIVEREDQESSTGSGYRPAPTLSRMKGLLPDSLRHSIPKPVRATISQGLVAFDRTFPGTDRQGATVQSPFARESIELVYAAYPEFATLPIINVDISTAMYATFKQFGNLVTQAAVVVTTRLHVGILAALLGKPVYLKTGNWHKIRGVYEYSLAAMENVKLI